MGCGTGRTGPRGPRMLVTALWWLLVAYVLLLVAFLGAVFGLAHLLGEYEDEYE